MGIIRIAKRWRMACCLSLLAFVAVSLSAVGAFSVRPAAVLAQADTYVADTSSQVSFSSLTSGARYLLCQFAAKTQKYEVLDGSTNSTKQIPFATPDYSTLANLQSGASSVASRYVSLVKVDEAQSYWYIRRNSDNYYFSSNASSDLVFSSGSTYSSSNRTYFVPSAESASDTIRFSVYNDTSLFLGTKVEGAYFDTWHDVPQLLRRISFFIGFITKTRRQRITPLPSFPRSDQFASQAGTPPSPLCVARGRRWKAGGKAFPRQLRTF